jgi:sulfur-carrier protein adenylyltransferase/sulfurtransferase
MKWLQFFTPVASINWQEAHDLIAATPDPGATLLDVRQPQEYASGHMPGAKLIPVGELESRWKELPLKQPIIVY